jgi:hypothetical protein
VIIFIGKVSRSINFSSLFYVFALSLLETLHSINNLAVSISGNAGNGKTNSGNVDWNDGFCLLGR